MANTASHHSGHSGGGRRWRWPGRALTLTRRDLLAFLIATMLCSASYCLGIWHNSRGAADSRILWPSAVGATSSCGGNDADEPLDFEAHHTAEAAGLSVSASAAARTTSTRRALRATETAPTAESASWGAAWMGNSIAGKR